MVRMVTPQRLDELLAAYGSDPRRWPDAERAGAQALLARAPELAARLDAARRLDAALDLVQGEVPATAAGRVAARIDRHISASLNRGDGGAPSWRAMLWSATGATWPRAAAFASVVVLGIVAGLSSDPSPSVATDGVLEEIAGASVMGEFASWSE